MREKGRKKMRVCALCGCFCVRFNGIWVYWGKLCLRVLYVASMFKSQIRISYVSDYQKGAGV